MKRIIRPDGRNHSMPNGMYEFFCGLGSLAGVEAVDSGRFIPRNKVNGFEANVQFYDESRGIFRLKVADKGYISYPEIRVSPDARDNVEDYIRGYRADGFASQGLPIALADTSYEINQTAMAVL